MEGASRGSSSSQNGQFTASPLFLREEEVRRGAELLFFGYTRFTSSIDELLDVQGLGRAHHRTLYFIARQPDINVGQLLAYLAITKQSLGRVLNELIERNLVETRPGDKDRRQKLLRLTNEGAAMEQKLFERLKQKMSLAYSEAGQEAVSGFWQVLHALIPNADKALVNELQNI
ncbi:MarR family transcriptional regulator [Sphingorhabdus lutea]|uniref:MarR family transcriptional regulator n=1 Tax=Sphingorhabdus lutea TaxID=1913578 RepID=A0A1L3JEL5_9SPHN|nr:MarR family transcriptional regulator [Sphingorhabdus lutea]